MMKKKTRKILSFILASVLIGQTLCVSGAENTAQSVLSEAAQHVQYEQKALRLLYDEPAQDSIDGWKNMSIPIGNGYMGVSLFGDVAADRMQVTEQSLYTTGTSYINNRYCGGQENFADVYIDTEHTMAEVTDYQRQLIFNDALASLSYVKDGVSYEREYFSSYPDKVTVVHLAASGEQNLNFTLRPVIAFERDKLEAPGAASNSGKHGTVVADGDTITLAGNSEYYNINFEAQFKIVLEGEKGNITAQNGTDENGNTDNGTLTVEGADSCYIIFAVGTNYELKSSVFTNPVSEKLDGSVYPHDKVSGYINDASAYTYEQLKQRHKQDYKSYFDRVVFDIGGTDDGRTTPELITSYKNGNQEKYLEELYFQMGRYMMIASSREGTLPAGLQAIWNAYDIPPWTAGYWYNVNQQMNYWPVFSANLAEMYKSYSDFNLVRLPKAELNGDGYIKSYRSSEYEEGTGKNGWIVGTGNNAYNVSEVKAGGHSGPGTGGFTTVSDIDYYRFTQDPSVLENVYPIIESLARFYSKCVDEYDGAYLATISASPENMENGKAYQTVGCAFDQQMIYENNKAVIDIYDEYKDILPNADEQLIEKLRRQIEHYETVLIGYSGQVKEYREEDYYGDIGEYQHRHISQLVGLYPGTSINDETPAWIDGAKVTLTERGITSGTGWSVAHKLGMWARTGDGETSYKLVQGLIKEHIFNNLWNKHDVTSDISQAVFQAEGNFGGTAGICEMLLQSQGEYIKILPALPSAWSDGSYKGLAARGNFEVCTSWKDGIAENIEVLSNAGGKLKLNYPNIANAKITKENGETVSFTGKTKDYAEFDTVKGEKYIITDISPFSVTENVSDVALSFEGENTTVSWTPSEAANAVYKIYRAFESEPVYELLAENVSETSYTDSERNGRQATYKVTATAQGCEESLGDTATAIPQASSVLNVTAFMADETHLQVQWEKPKYAQKYVVYEYIDGEYVKLFETEDEICIIENASSDKTYAVSSLYYETESAKEHVVISEIGLNVSKLELYEYISQIKALSEKGFSEADMKLISDDINTVTKTWKDINATISEVEASIELAKKALESASYFSFNVLKGKSGTVEAGNSSEHSGYPLSNVTDGDVNTRFAGYETDKFVITYELGELHTVSSFELVDFMDSRGSRDDYAVIEGKAANGKWLKMAERSLLDLTQTSSKRTASIGSELSLPVSAIRLTLTNTDSYKNGYSIWEFSAVGAKIDTRPKVMSLNVNPEKPDIGTKYEIVNNIDNGIMFYSDRTTFAAYHLGSGFKGLTQLRLPVNDSTRQNSTALNTFLQGDNTYFTFTANSDGKVYIAYEGVLPNLTEERGWKKISSSVPPLPDGHEKINTVDKNYEFSGYPYYLTQVQWVSNPDVIDYAAQRGFVYEKAFSAYENVEVPTIGIASNQNYFAAVELSGENSNTELEYIFCGDEAVKTQSGKTDYEFEVSADTQSVVLDALAKNLGAEVSCPAEPLTFTKGKASAEIVVSAGEKTTKYTVTVKKEKVISNVALNKTVTVDPVSLTSAGGFGSFSNEAIVDGVYANARGRYYSGAKNNITAVIDLGATYTISYINVAEILNNEPMRTDMLTIESYNNGEWSTRILNKPLNGEAETQNDAQYSKTRFDFEETFDASLLKFTFKNSGVVNGETAVTGTLESGKTYTYYPVAGTSTRDISIVEIEAYGIETQQEENQSAELSAVLIDGLSIGEIKADTYSYRVYTMSDSVTVKGIAKSSSASVSEEQVLDLSGGSAKAEITVTGSGGDVLKYEIVVFKVSNIALNKPVTIDPTSGYASHPNENVVDGDFTTRYARSGAYCPTVVIDLEDKYTVIEFDVAEFRNPVSVPMRIDNLSIYGYVNDEWVLLKTGIKLDGEVINNLYSKTNIKLDEPAQNVSKLKLNFENTGYTNNYPIAETITHGTTTTDVYSISGTAKRDCSIMEIMAYGTAEQEEQKVFVSPENSLYDANVLTDSNLQTFYETRAIDFSTEKASVTVKSSGKTDISRILITPRQYADGEEYFNDRPVSYTLYTSDDNLSFSQIKQGTIEYADFNDYDTKTIELDTPVNANYIKIEFGDVYGARADKNKYLSLAEIGFVLKADIPNEPLDGMQFYNIRDGFSNSYLKFTMNKEATVAFLGGSITESSGYRTNVQNYLKEKFPDTQFTFIDAGIASTDSTMGAFRLNKDILSKGKVDLLFVEFAVNDEDNGRSREESIRGMEGIIYQAYESNPYMDICVMHFADPNKHSQYSSNENHIMPVIENQEAAVSHYNVTSLNLAKEVSARIENGELTWEEFGGKHPSSVGHKIYSDGIIAVLEKSWENNNTEMRAKVIPQLKDKNSYISGRFEDISDANIISGFAYDKSWTPSDSAATRKGFVNVPMLESTDTSAELTYTFTGTDIGILLPAGPDVGYITYKVDEGEAKTQNLFTNWSASLHMPWVYMLETGLEYGEHTLTISASETKDERSNGNAVRIQSFLVNGKNNTAAETSYSVSVSSGGGKILSSVDGGIQENWESSYTGEYRQGTSISLNALSADGKSFMYWKDVYSNRIVSYASEYEFSVGSDKNIIAVYADDTAAYITFKNANGLIYASDYNSVVIPSNPNMMGYTFAGWFVNSENIGKAEGEVYTANENTHVIAGWKLDDKMYSVVVKEANEEGGNYKYNSKITLTAPGENSLGEKFAYWRRDGKIVCYDMTYTFYVYADTVAEAVYSDETAQSAAVVTMSEPIITDTGSIAFFAERSVSPEMTVIESGILLGTGAELSLDNYTYKAVSGSLSNSGQYTVRKKNVSSGETWYGKAYVVYKDAEGSVCTAYSNEVSKTID